MDEEKCQWLDEYKKCWYWMPDSKMTCDCLDNQEKCKEYSIREDKNGR